MMTVTDLGTMLPPGLRARRSPLAAVLAIC